MFIECQKLLMQHMHSNILLKFDFRADPVPHLPLLKSFMVKRFRSLFRLFSVFFKPKLIFLQYNVKNVHPVFEPTNLLNERSNNHKPKTPASLY